MQQLYAKIKKSSEYSHQSDDFFEVLVYASNNPKGYNVMGGPGGQYRLKDVNLYVKNEMDDEDENKYEGEMMKIS